MQDDACRPPEQALYSRTGAHPTTATIVDRLKELSFFSDIPENDLRQIAEIMVEKSYRKGAVIIEE